MRNTKPKQEKQKEIIDAALQLFLEKGYEKTSIKDITEKMNIATGLFHYYFSSKEDVLIKCAYLNSQIITEELQLETFFEGKGNAVDKINLLMSQVLHNVAERNDIIKDSAKINEALLLDRITYITLDIIITKLVEFIKEGNNEKIFDCPCPQETAEILVYGFERMFRNQKEKDSSLRDMTLSEYFIQNKYKLAEMFERLLCIKYDYHFQFEEYEKV